LLKNEEHNQHPRNRESSISSDLYIDKWTFEDFKPVIVEFSAAVYAIKQNQSKCLITLKKLFDL
jgi:hypothetical protein